MPIHLTPNSIGRGGGVGVECSPKDAEVLGSIPGVDGNFYFLSSHQFSTSVSVTLTLDIGLSYRSVFPLQFAKLTTGHFFPVLPILSSSVCKLYKVNNCSFCLYSLSLSLLEPSIQYETDALRLQWREQKTLLIPTKAEAASKVLDLVLGETNITRLISL